MNVQIVDLTPEYIDGALDVFYESNLLHCSGAPDYFRKIPKEHSRPYLEWIIRNENTFGLVALADGKVAGIVFAAKEEKPDTLFLYQRYYKIYDIAVSEAFRGQKIGQRLNNAVKARAKADNIANIELEVFCFNSGAMAFYHKLGYTEVSQIMSLKV